MAANLTLARAENAGKIYLKEAVVERQSFGLGFRLLLPEDREGVTEEKLEGTTTNTLPLENPTCGLFVCAFPLSATAVKQIVCCLCLGSLFILCFCSTGSSPSGGF